MRILPRIRKPKFYPYRKTWRRVQPHLSVWRLALAIEIVAFVTVYLLVFTGSRRAWMDGWGARTDLVASFLMVGAFVVLHYALKKSVIPRIERHFLPTAYKEREILFSLGHEARLASNVEELFAAIAKHIADSFEADNVSILVCDETTRDYVSVISSSPAQVGKQRSATTDETPDSQVKLSRDAFVVKRLRNLSTPLVIDSRELEIWERAMEGGSARFRLARQQEREALGKLKSRLLVQIRIKDQMMGILSLGARRKQFRYSVADKEVVTSVAGQLALVIENSRLAQRMVAQERLSRELLLAVEVQQRLLPSQGPDDLTLELAGFCEPARGVGGDYYDFITREDRQLGIAIADVSGKGLPAALLMSTVQATVRSLAARNGSSGPDSSSLSETVGILNQLLCDATRGANYVTFFYAQFDPSTKQLAYVNAGHNPPLYLRADSVDDFTSLTSGGLIVGIFKDCIYEQGVVETRPGDMLFAYTDGLTEALNRNGEEFGEARLRAVLTATARLSVYEIREELVRQINEWCMDAPQYDDLTFVVMKVPPEVSLGDVDPVHAVGRPFEFKELEPLAC